ncbi:MAG: hypothetical protein EPN48_00860 [Microbacteriaceae bacterium]|nr:MAG: hypothetical protein EPN48_00860 [Microbacteriaceae bacterium]
MELKAVDRAATATRDPVPSARLWEGATVAAIIAIGWLVLAVNHPTTTYHFTPLVIVIAPVALMRMRVDRSLPWRCVMSGTGIGVAFALVASAILFASGSLRGPGLVGSIGPVAEVFIAIGLGIVTAIGPTVVRCVHVKK